MGSLQEQIVEAWKTALRGGDAQRRDTLSGLRAAIKNAEIGNRVSGAAGGAAALDEAAVQSVIEREAKKRRDAIDEYNKVNRPDRAAIEAAELKILEEFLPAQLTDRELEELVRAAIEPLRAGGATEMGKLMQAAMAAVAGRADGKRVNAIVRRSLA